MHGPDFLRRVSLRYSIQAAWPGQFLAVEVIWN